MKILLILGLYILLVNSSFADHADGHVDVNVGELTQRGAIGQTLFNTNCAGCHGNDAQGGNTGPPLIHDLYNPGHHDGSSFLRAIKKGVGQHHWPYGNMPPQPQVGFSEAQAIVTFIRELQSQNGIKFKKHRM